MIRPVYRIELEPFFFGAIFLMFGGMLPPMALLAIERKQFLFQYMEALYTPIVYYTSKVLPEIVPVIFNTTVFSIIFYFMLNLRLSPDHFFIFWGLANLLVLAAQAFAFFFAGLVPDLGVLMSLFPVFFFPANDFLWILFKFSLNSSLLYLGRIPVHYKIYFPSYVQ